jgi:hypothetical protein
MRRPAWSKPPSGPVTGRRLPRRWTVWLNGPWPRDTEWALGLFARSRALLATSADAETLYQEAIGHLERTRAVPELTRAHLLYGEWLRSQRRRRDARGRLRSRRRCLSRWARAPSPRARPSCAPSASGPESDGRDQRRAHPAGSPDRRACRMRHVDPEIAGQLFISASTVEYHLRKVFRKLGVISRTQLVSALREGNPQD